MHASRDSSFSRCGCSRIELLDAFSFPLLGLSFFIAIHRLDLGDEDGCRSRALLNIFFNLLDPCIFPSTDCNLYRSIKATV